MANRLESQGLLGFQVQSHQDRVYQAAHRHSIHFQGRDPLVLWSEREKMVRAGRRRKPKFFQVSAGPDILHNKDVGSSRHYYIFSCLVETKRSTACGIWTSSDAGRSDSRVAGR